MPLTASQLTQLHRRQQLALRKATIAEVERLWPALAFDNLDGSYPVLAGSIAKAVAKYRRTSAGLSAAFLRAHRVASGLDGAVDVALPGVLDLEQFDASLHPFAVAGVKVATAKAVAPDVAMRNALTLSSGSMSRLVLSAGRETVTQTVQSDRRGIGWRRVLGGGGCDFCRELAGRVYPSDNADFEAHGQCGCTSEPVWD